MLRFMISTHGPNNLSNAFIFKTANFTLSLQAYTEATRGFCNTNANSPKYLPLPNRETSFSVWLCLSNTFTQTSPSIIKYITSAVSPSFIIISFVLYVSTSNASVKFINSYGVNESNIETPFSSSSKCCRFLAVAFTTI